MSRPLIARISLQALERNVARVKALAPQHKVMAVIKANGYGHGMLECAKTLDAHVDAFAVLTMSEAQRLREAGFKHPIMLLEGVFRKEDYDRVSALHLTPVIHGAHQISALEEAGSAVPKAVFLKVDSGMHRLGFPPRELMPAFDRLQALTEPPETVLMTHYAAADEKGGALKPQQVMENLLVIHPKLADLESSFGNSAAIASGAGFGVPVALGTWVRPGIMLYGASPLLHVDAKALGLCPVMRLSSEIISVRDIERKDAVGYGRAFLADRPMRIGVVACGYADGYPRHAPTGTPVIVDGQRTRLLGRVSMDMLSVDLTDLEGAAVGAPVELFGENLSIDELARHAGTISYEILTGIAARVPRVFE